MTRFSSKSTFSGGPQADPVGRVGRHALRPADEYPVDEHIDQDPIPPKRYPTRSRDRWPVLACSADIAANFDDAFIAELWEELPPGANLNIFAAGVREAARVYKIDAREPDNNDLHHKIAALYDAAQRRKHEAVMLLREGLSPRAASYLEDRATRPGPRAAGFRLPTAEELRDPEQRERACQAIEQLCRIGGLPVEGRKRSGRKHPRRTFRPLLHALELRRHVPKREPERNFVMNLQTTWLEATGTMPPALPAMRTMLAGWVLLQRSRASVCMP